MRPDQINNSNLAAQKPDTNDPLIQPEKRSKANPVTLDSVKNLRASVENDLEAINAHITANPHDDFFQLASNPDISVNKISRDGKSKYFIAFPEVIANGEFSTIHYSVPLLETNIGYVLPEIDDNKLSQAKMETYQFSETDKVRACFAFNDPNKVIEELQKSSPKFSSYYGAKLNEEKQLCDIRKEEYHGKLLIIDPEKLIVKRIDVLPLYIGEDLFEALGKIQSYTLTQQMTIIVNTIREIVSLHKKGLVIGDIKPENFIFDPKTLAVKAIDLAYGGKIANPNLKASRDMPHAAPEVLDTGEASLKTDSYSLSVLIIELLYWCFVTVDEETDKWVCKEDGTLEICVDKDLIKNARGLSESIIDFLEEGLAFNPEERPDSEVILGFFEEVLDEFKELDEEEKAGIKKSSSMEHLNFFAKPTSHASTADASEEKSEFSTRK